MTLDVPLRKRRLSAPAFGIAAGGRRSAVADHYIAGRHGDALLTALNGTFGVGGSSAQ
jgi:hypothetical protein